MKYMYNKHYENMKKMNKLQIKAIELMICFWGGKCWKQHNNN